MTPRPNESRIALRHAERRKVILAAAAEEFAATGYHAATLEQIGGRVGLSKASLYYYVSAKSELLAGLLTTVSERAEARAAEVATEEPLERLRAFVHSHVSDVINTVDGRVLADTQAVLMSKSAPPSLVAARRRYEDVLATIVSDGVEHGQFRELPVRPFVKFVFGGLNSFPHWYEVQGQHPLEQIVEDIVAILLSGMAGNGGQPPDEASVPPGAIGTVPANEEKPCTS